MNKKLLVKTALPLLVGCSFIVTQTTFVNVAPKPDENKVAVTEPTTNVDTICDIYKDNVFELITKEKEKESVASFNEAITSASAIIEAFVRSMVKGLGGFNAVMVKILFSMDVITVIRQPIMNLTLSIATSMLGIAGTTDIAFIFVILGAKSTG